MPKGSKKHSKKAKDKQLGWTIANTIINLLRLIVDIFRNKH
jgi:hypothetical protein